MKRSFMLLVLAFPLAGCLLRTGPPRQTVVERRSCGPAYHWEGDSCVHNGNGNGHGHEHEHEHGHGHDRD